MNVSSLELSNQKSWVMGLTLLSGPYSLSIETSFCVQDLTNLVNIVAHVLYAFGADGTELRCNDKGRNAPACLADLGACGAEAHVQLRCKPLEIGHGQLDMPSPVKHLHLV